MHAAPDRVAAALTNLLLNLVLVKRAREALRSMDRRNYLFTDLSTLRKNRAALVLREHELDRVPEDLLRRSLRRCLRRLNVVAGRQLLSVSFHRALYLGVIIASVGDTRLLGNLLCMYVGDGQLRFDFLLQVADYKNLALSHLELELAQFAGLGCKVANEFVVRRCGGSGRVVRARCGRLSEIVHFHFFSDAAGLLRLFYGAFKHHFVDKFSYGLVFNCVDSKNQVSDGFFLIF